MVGPWQQRGCWLLLRRSPSLGPTIASSSVRFFVSHPIRFAWTVTCCGAARTKSGSTVLFAEGTRTPTRRLATMSFSFSRDRLKRPRPPSPASERRHISAASTHRRGARRPERSHRVPVVCEPSALRFARPLSHRRCEGVGGEEAASSSLYDHAPCVVTPRGRAEYHLC